MKIYNTVPYFLENFEPTVQFLQRYHDKYTSHFKEYFLYHCKNAEEKKEYAIKHYPSKINEIKMSNGKIESLINKIATSYNEKYNVEFQKDVHVIVGCYGSNAFTHRQIIPEITFCLEKLSPEEEHLKVIIAHEFGHAVHNILSNKSGMEWSKLQWYQPFVWLLQEGSATYFSKQIVEAEESVYFSYDSSGNGWLQFAKSNTQEIVNSFLKDFNNLSHQDIFREWFSINGGNRYGHTRLGYYIGYIVLESLIKRYGELNAITLWKNPWFTDEVTRVLLKLKNS